MPMWEYPYNYGMGGMLWGTVIMLLCLTAFGVVIWYALSLIERRERRNQEDAPLPSQPGALETLRRRYARGEIDEPTFMRMHDQLMPRDTAAPPEPVTPR